MNENQQAVITRLKSLEQRHKVIEAISALATFIEDGGKEQFRGTFKNWIQIGGEKIVLGSADNYLRPQRFATLLADSIGFYIPPASNEAWMPVAQLLTEFFANTEVLQSKAEWVNGMLADWTGNRLFCRLKVATNNEELFRLLTEIRSKQGEEMHVDSFVKTSCIIWKNRYYIRASVAMKGMRQMGYTFEQNELLSALRETGWEGNYLLQCRVGNDVQKVRTWRAPENWAQNEGINE